MKIEKITENKIRIILDQDELSKKNIDLVSLTKNTDVAQKLFKKILKQAEKEVDFHFEDSKLLIEAFVSSDGFFIITFTKLNSEKNSPIGKPIKLKVKRNVYHFSNNSSIYLFDTFEEFCSFCTYFNNLSLNNFKSFTKNVSLYEYNFRYYLVLTNIDFDSEIISLFNASISEFANIISDSSLFISKLSEYGKIIFKNNALNNGIKYFSK